MSDPPSLAEPDKLPLPSWGGSKGGPRLILVTGANGFIGSHLVEALLARGYHVRCMVRRTSDLTHLRNLHVEWAYTALPVLSASEGSDSERDSSEGLREACQGVDAVCHCAALTRALDEATFMRVNAAGTEALARACIEVNPGLRRFLLVSSQAACGPSQRADHFVDEFCLAQPINWYGKSKLAAERALQRLGSRLPITIVRPSAVFGPRDRDFLAYFKLVKAGLNVQVGRGDRWLSLIYVRDLIRLILLALESSESTAQLYFGCGQPSGLKRTDFADAIAKALNKRTRRITLPMAVLTAIGLWSKVQGRLTHRPALLNDQRVLDMKERYWLCSGDKARRELGFVASYDLQTAVQETADWYLQNGWL